MGRRGTGSRWWAGEAPGAGRGQQGRGAGRASTTPPPPSLHHHSSTTPPPPPSRHHHPSATTPPPPPLQHLSTTSTRPPPSRHHQPATTSPPLPPRHHHPTTTTPHLARLGHKDQVLLVRPPRRRKGAAIPLEGRHQGAVGSHHPHRRARAVTGAHSHDAAVVAQGGDGAAVARGNDPDWRGVGGRLCMLGWVRADRCTRRAWQSAGGGTATPPPKPRILRKGPDGCPACTLPFLFHPTRLLSSAAARPDVRPPARATPPPMPPPPPPHPTRLTACPPSPPPSWACTGTPAHRNGPRTAASRRPTWAGGEGGCQGGAGRSRDGRRASALSRRHHPDGDAGGPPAWRGRRAAGRPSAARASAPARPLAATPCARGSSSRGQRSRWRSGRSGQRGRAHRNVRQRRSVVCRAAGRGCAGFVAHPRALSHRSSSFPSFPPPIHSLTPPRGSAWREESTRRRRQNRPLRRSRA